MRSILAISLLVPLLDAQSPCFYVPDPVPENYGGATGNASSAPLAFVMQTNYRSLIVVPSIRFANVPRWIDDLAFVPLGTDISECDELIVRLSHTSATTVVDQFAPYITEPQVEVLRVRTHRFVRIANTWMRLGLQRPFLYIPARGNLLIDVIAMGARPDPRGTGERTFARAAPNVGYAATGSDTLLVPDRGGSASFPKLAICSAAAGLDWFGKGCPGTGGLVPVLGLDGSPTLGGTVDIWVSNAPASTGTYLMRVLDNGAAFPMDLSSVGMTGCRMYFSPLDATPTSTNPFGIALSSLGIPASSALLGAVLYVQGLIVDPAGNALGLTTTNYGRIQIGS
ncbi:MAG: hypothetical protein HZB39_07310 [Planctomycetes bacterium]|nr:hypothetical protein [Planctomycetota bacterium]